MATIEDLAHQIFEQQMGEVYKFWVLFKTDWIIKCTDWYVKTKSQEKIFGTDKASGHFPQKAEEPNMSILKLCCKAFFAKVCPTEIKNSLAVFPLSH